MEKTIRLSDLGEGLNEAQLIEWHVNLNDEIAEGDLIVLKQQNQLLSFHLLLVERLPNFFINW